MQTKEDREKCNWEHNLKNEEERILQLTEFPLYPNGIQKIIDHSFVFNYIILDEDTSDQVIREIVNSNWKNIDFAGTIRGIVTGLTNTTSNGLLIEVSTKFLDDKAIIGICLNRERIWQVKLDRNEHSSYIYYCGLFELI